ncbi:methionine synthase [Acrocarpospora corrugata]|uniref:Methionine synthase n=1 Tax=Acrocarpospora corrugata TaxID=35763 RepID=A0A5M3VZ72_9ACTN|nr:uroporphyrinogen decarboxylase family protein [Acrocarpospora corrugata]GES00383.1 methionine synthase [Acrocarpospora corrugata]
MAVDDALVTTVVGSYPQPDWLVNREMLGSRLPPRVRAQEIWRIPEEFLAEAQDDATIIAIRDMERAGIEIVTDGEIRRESYSNRFATALDGMDVENPGTAIDRTGHPNPVPRAVGPIHRVRPVGVEDLEFLRRNTDRPVKITLPGPFTMAQQAQDDFFGDRRSLALALAEAVRAEVTDLFAAGADIVQLDEPYLQARPEAAREYAIEAINRAVEGLPGTIALHTCFGYAAIVHERPPGYSFLAELNDCAADLIAIETAQPGLDLSILGQLSDKGVILGVVDLSDPAVETPGTIAARIREALRYHAPDKLQIAPDCGMKYLPRARAFAKLQAMTEAARIVRAELAG